MSLAEHKRVLLELVDEASQEAEQRIFRELRENKDQEARQQHLLMLDVLHLAVRELRISIDRLERF